MATTVSIVQLILIERLLRRVIIEGTSSLDMSILMASELSMTALLASLLSPGIAETSAVSLSIPADSGFCNRISLQSHLET